MALTCKIVASHAQAQQALTMHYFSLSVMQCPLTKHACLRSNAEMLASCAGLLTCSLSTGQLMWAGALNTKRRLCFWPGLKRPMATSPSAPTVSSLRPSRFIGVRSTRPASSSYLPCARPLSHPSHLKGFADQCNHPWCCRGFYPSPQSSSGSCMSLGLHAPAQPTRQMHSARPIAFLSALSCMWQNMIAPSSHN